MPDDLRSNPKAPVRLDPVRATEAAVISSYLECAIVFRRIVMVEDDAGRRFDTAPSAAVSLPWQVARQLCDLLTRQLEEHEERVAAMKEPSPLSALQ